MYVSQLHEGRNQGSPLPGCGQLRKQAGGPRRMVQEDLVHKKPAAGLERRSHKVQQTRYNACSGLTVSAGDILVQETQQGSKSGLTGLQTRQSRGLPPVPP